MLYHLLGVDKPFCFVLGVVASMTRDIKIIDTAISVNIPDSLVVDSYALESLSRLDPSIKRNMKISDNISGGSRSVFAVTIECLVGIGDSLRLT